ncbi:hemerythrin family protein [bacterium]|nr:hemerythrin family protein [bacterium]
MAATQKLEWSDNFSVNVKELDEQHKGLVTIINNLLDYIGNKPEEKEVLSVINKIAEYKKKHFETEEMYFDKFNYEGKEEHKKSHKEFNEELTQLLLVHKDDYLTLAFALIDFLEDWLVDHLQNMDKKYVECFNSHGLY